MPLNDVVLASGYTLRVGVTANILETLLNKIHWKHFTTKFTGNTPQQKNKWLQGNSHRSSSINLTGLTKRQVKTTSGLCLEIPLLCPHSERLQRTATNSEIETATHALGHIMNNSKHTLPEEHSAD
ncbi:hypothetical protein J6590_046097 [Homalodisca vitripennis]|nr:hypothetical protein J6590_046097 [Homalodisca vitripennis]